MPDNPLVPVVRPDGSTLYVPPQDAAELQSAGYHSETPAEQLERNRAASSKEYYTSPLQKAATVGEGISAGLTFGGSDALFDAAGFDTSERAHYNAGTRLASEFGGALLPSLFAPESIPGSLLRLTPAGAVAGVAGRLAPIISDSRAAQGVVRGVIEGVPQSVGAEVSNSVLSGDPLTAEAVVSAIGMGALVGGVGGAVLGKVDQAAEGFAARRAAAKAEAEALNPESYAAFHSSLTDARKVAGQVAKTAESEIEAATKAAKIPARDLEASLSSREAAAEKYINDATAEGRVNQTSREAKNNALSAIRRASTAAADGDIEGVQRALAEHSEHIADFAAITKTQAPALENLFAQKSAAAEGALKEVALLRQATELKLPMSPKGFAGMQPAELTKRAEAVDAFLSTKSPELEGVRQSVRQSIGSLVESAGIKVEGGPAEQLKAVWEASRKATKAAGSGGVVDKAKQAFTGWALGSALGHPAVGTLLGAKAAVMGTLRDAVVNWAPKVTRAAVKANLPARIDPLRRRIDGTMEEAKKTRRELVKERLEEVQRTAPIIADRAYKAVAPISGEHPDFAKAVHDHVVSRYAALVEQSPKDPGQSIIRGKSTWAPDFISTEKFSRWYEVFHDPVGVAKRMLDTGEIHPESAMALKAMSPETFGELRIGMLERLSEPGQMEKLSYREQISLGGLLDVPLNSASTPRFISAQQAMFTKRNQPQPVNSARSASTNPSGSGMNGGRPSGASAAQMITEH
jgi:hypothetical protein